MFRMRPPRYLVLLPLLAIAVLNSCTTWGKPASGFKGATGGEQLERALWDGIRGGRWKEIRNHLAPAFTMTTAAGTLNREQALANWESAKPSDYSIAELQVQPNGADAVVSYVLTLSSAAGDHQTYRAMTVWQQSGTHWVAIAHSETPVTREGNPNSSPAPTQ